MPRSDLAAGPQAPPRVVVLPPRRTPGGPPRWARRLAFVVALVGLIASVPVLVRLGWQRAIRADGEVSAAATGDPTAPGYRVVVSPTSTLLVVHRGPDGSLAGVSLLASAGQDGGGAVLLVPLTLLVDPDGSRPRTLASVYRTGGVEALSAAVSEVLRMGFGRVVTADPRDWAGAVGNRTLTVDNPDDLTEVDGTVRFEAGTVRLGGADVEPYLRLRKPGEEDRSRLYRSRLLWRAWFASMTASPPPERTDPFSAMVTDLARSSVEVVDLPVVVAGESLAGATDNAAVPGTPETTYRVDRAAADSLLATLVPFPTSARPGDRVRVRLLNGNGDAAATLELSGRLVPAGAEIVVFGNAGRFDIATTEVEYYVESERADAEAMAAVLGVASARFNPVGDATVDVGVIVGTDLVGPSSGPGTARPTSTTRRQG